MRRSRTNRRSWRSPRCARAASPCTTRPRRAQADPACGSCRPRCGRLVAVAGVDLIKHAQIRGPVMAAASGIVMLILFSGLGADVRRNLDHLAAGRLQLELNIGGVDEMF